MTEKDLAFWVKLAEVSPTLMIVAGFIAVTLWLKRLGLIDLFRDPTEGTWRRGVEGEMSDLKSRVSHLEGYIDGSKK